MMPGLVSDSDIRRLVDTFYDRTRQDDLLGPVFEGAIGTEAEAWAPHLDKMYAFWSSVLNGTGRYDGRPMPAHARLLPDRISPDHFARWLALFQATADEVLPPDQATAVTAKADQIGRGLQMGLFRLR